MTPIPCIHLTAATRASLHTTEAGAPIVMVKVSTRGRPRVWYWRPLARVHVGWGR